MSDTRIPLSERSTAWWKEFDRGTEVSDPLVTKRVDHVTSAVKDVVQGVGRLLLAPAIAAVDRESLQLHRNYKRLQAHTGQLDDPMSYAEAVGRTLVLGAKQLLVALPAHIGAAIVLAAHKNDG